MDSVKRICLWSGPRNISTALMYAFAQRKDTKVFDEPLYAHYLKTHPEAHKYHPGTKDILATMENDGEKVVSATILRNNEKPVLFFKQMTHHLYGLNRDFLKHTINIILTRNPKEMLPSFDKVIPNPSLDDVGYALHVDLVNYFKAKDMRFTVLDAKSVLLNPEDKLKKLCEFIAIPFDGQMLSWPPQPIPEDGIWAKNWYNSVHQSTGFLEYTPKSGEFPNHLQPLLSECRPYYTELKTYAL